MRLNDDEVEPVAKVGGKDGFFVEIFEDGVDGDHEPRYRVLWKEPRLCGEDGLPLATPAAHTQAWELVDSLAPSDLDRGLAYTPKLGIGIRLPASRYWEGA